MKTPKKQTMSAAELAAYMDVHEKTIKGDAESGRIPYMPVGSRRIYRFVLEDVLAAYRALATKEIK
jgi:excisionase family DNA binding protein